MNQLMLGAFVPFLVGLVLYARRGFRASFRMLAATPALMGLGALWAVAPDLPRLFGQYGLYQRLAADPRTNVFFWHYTIDRMETDARWIPVVFVLMLAGLLAASWREVCLLEKQSHG
jgi:hypothetical protein